MRKTKPEEIKQLDLYPVSPALNQMVKNQPAMQETLIQSLGGEDSLEKGMATCSSILAWRFPWREEPGRLYSSWGCRVRHN